MTATETPATEVRRYTFTGRILDGERVLFGAFVGDDPTERFATKLPTWAKRLHPGQMVDVTFDVGTASYYVSGPKGPAYVGLVDDVDARARWQIRDRAAAAWIQQRREVAKDGGDDAVERLAEPLRNLYAEASPFERSALLVRILAAVQGTRR